MIDVFLLLGGLLLILLGANGLTDGAAALAKRLRISDMVIGLTIVAFGTSAPELTVSVASALRGSADMAVGNVVGSNLFNTLMIVGCTALVAPIIVTRRTLRVEVPLCILASVALCVCANDALFNGSVANRIDRTDGLLLLCFFAIFLGYTFSISREKNISLGEKEENALVHTSSEESIAAMPLWRSLLYIVGGLAGLVVGGNLFVNGACDIARGLGVSEGVIGLTLVAGGTSLPELATSVVAAWKKNPEIAIGNVVGSNLFNIFLVLGVSASITPLGLQGIGRFDLFCLVGSSVLLWLVGFFYGKRIITRLEGCVLVAGYLAYTSWLIYQL